MRLQYDSAYKSVWKRILRKGETFLEPSRRSQKGHRDSLLPPSDSFLFHSLVFYSAKTSEEGTLEAPAPCIVWEAPQLKDSMMGTQTPSPAPVTPLTGQSWVTLLFFMSQCLPHWAVNPLGLRAVSKSSMYSKCPSGLDLEQMLVHVSGCKYKSLPCAKQCPGY